MNILVRHKLGIGATICAGAIVLLIFLGCPSMASEARAK